MSGCCLEGLESRNCLAGLLDVCVCCDGASRLTFGATFGGGLARNACFGDLTRDFWRKSRTQRLFCRLEEVSRETLVLET